MTWVDFPAAVNEPLSECATSKVALSPQAKTRRLIHTNLSCQNVQTSFFGDAPLSTPPMPSWVQLIKFSLGRRTGMGKHPSCNDSALAGPVLCTRTTGSSSPALSYVDDEDPDAATQFSKILLGNNVPIPHTTSDPKILMEQDRPSVISRPSTPLSRSLDHPQTMVDS